MQNNRGVASPKDCHSLRRLQPSFWHGHGHARDQVGAPCRGAGAAGRSRRSRAEAQEQYARCTAEFRPPGNLPPLGAGLLWPGTSARPARSSRLDARGWASTHAPSGHLPASTGTDLPPSPGSTSRSWRAAHVRPGLRDLAPHRRGRAAHRLERGPTADRRPLRWRSAPSGPPRAAGLREAWHGLGTVGTVLDERCAPAAPLLAVSGPSLGRPGRRWAVK
jgi:hypothetical protein